MGKLTSRITTTFVLLLQLGMFVAVPIVHAEAEAAALATPLHISSEVDHGCSTHVDDLCQLCRWSLRALEAATRPAAQLPGNTQRTAGRHSAICWIAQLRTFLPLGPRAPPA